MRTRVRRLILFPRPLCLIVRNKRRRRLPPRAANHLDAMLRTERLDFERALIDNGYSLTQFRSWPPRVQRRLIARFYRQRYT